jgi:acetyl-CoA synthetase
MIAWTPDENTRERAQLTRFLRFTDHADFDSLYRWSVEHPGPFTEAVLRFLEIPFHQPYDAILDLSRGREWPRWCVNGRLNIANACLRHDAARPAVIWESEDGSTRTLTYGELRLQVEAFSAQLHRGEPIAIHLPMVPETVVALIACAHAGAVAVPLFSGYGPAAIDSRIRDVGARTIVTCDTFPRRGKAVTPARTSAVERTILLPYGRAFKPPGAREAVADTSAEDSLIVLYTSGTTGRPKGIQHTHCGFPVKSAQDMCFGTDVGPGTRICWITDIGWMMGPWLIYGALILGATICLYDGAPDYPDPGRLWSFVERHQVEVLGISPTLVRALVPHGPEFARRHDLSSLRILASTGEPWNPDPWWWLFEHVGRHRVPIINYSGGTEISGGILMSNPLLPVKPCAFAAPCPGIAADVVDESGRSVENAVGELVIRQPWIGQARGFVNDPERYLATYWSRWPGVWAHGDWAMRESDGQWLILGRSDDTLKVAGKRVGPAEVESILVGHEAVAEAAAIGVPHEMKGECIVVFCVLAPTFAASEALGTELRDLVAADLGKPLRPEAVHFVQALPKTRNAKVMRRVIRAAYIGQDPGDLTALENPAAVEKIREARQS